jgi:bromodomain adjacent to zinc finger domain protein 1A
VLRLHLLVAGSQANENNRRFRYQERGAFSSYDDAGMEFRQLEPQLMNSLAETSVYDLSPGNKLKLVSVLIHQLLTYCSCRDMIEDAAEKVKQGRTDLRLLQAGELRREREWAAFK